MPKTTKNPKSTKKPNERRPLPVVVSMGCPCGVGPEICAAATLSRSTPPALIVGDRGALEEAAALLGLSFEGTSELRPFDEAEGAFHGIRLLEASRLRRRDRKWGRPGAVAGAAQLEYVEQAYRLAREQKWPLVTAPVSKSMIARSGSQRASRFLGHTEWLQTLDGARHSVMCFSSPKLVTSLVTTHVPVRKLSRSITPERVARATLELVDLLLRTGVKSPRVAVASLNPHAGEEKLLGGEERTAIAPGIEQARRVAGRRAKIEGPVGAETAFRKGAAGVYDGVVAMYHDQATIPMKLLDFGGAVNVTQGLSVVRTSVDHGTAYDIAGQGVADARGMREAMKLAVRLGQARRRINHGSW